MTWCIIIIGALFVFAMCVDFIVFRELGILCRNSDEFKKLSFSKKVATIIGMIVVECIIFLFLMCGILVLMLL